MMRQRHHRRRSVRHAQGAGRAGPQPLEDAWRRLLRNRAAVLSMVVLGVIALMAVLAPLLSPYAYDAQDYTLISCAPNWWPARSLPCGRTRTGLAPISRARPVHSRALRRARLAVGGTCRHHGQPCHRGAYGAVAGYIGGRIDSLMMRVGGHPLRAALHLFRDHSDGHIQSELHFAVCGDRRGILADHGANCPGTDAFGEAEGICGSCARSGRGHLRHHSARTCPFLRRPRKRITSCSRVVATVTAFFPASTRHAPFARTFCAALPSGAG